MVRVFPQVAEIFILDWIGRPDTIEHSQVVSPMPGFEFPDISPRITQPVDSPEAESGSKQKEVRQVKKFVFALFMVAFALAAAPHAMAVVTVPEGGENLPYLIMAGASCFGAMVYRIRGFRKK